MYNINVNKYVGIYENTGRTTVHYKQNYGVIKCFIRVY